MPVQPFARPPNVKVMANAPVSWLIVVSSNVLTISEGGPATTGASCVMVIADVAAKKVSSLTSRT